MHQAGLPITLLHEVITVGVGMHQAELHKLAIRLSIFAITATMGDDEKMTPRTATMHPSDLEADTADKDRWPHILLYKRYLPHNELEARRSMLRRNKKRMVPAFKDLLLEGPKSWGTRAAIESIGCYTERLPQRGFPVGMKPFMQQPKWVLRVHGLRNGAGGEARAREEELEALKREPSLLKYKCQFEIAYRMVRAPGRLVVYATEIAYDLTRDRRFNGTDFAEGWSHALESVDQLPVVSSTEWEWRD
eukprot:jgi/Tetstr1/460104/TSEL_005420.t1